MSIFELGAIAGFLGLGQTSEDVVNEVSNVVTSVSMKTLNTCISKASQSQIISVSNIKGDVTFSGNKLVQGVTIDVSCLLSSNKQASMASNIASALTQFATSKGTDILGLFGKEKASATANLESQISTQINMDSILKNVSSLSQKQGLYFNNIKGNLVILNTSLEQSAALTVQAVQNTALSSSVVNDIAHQISQKTDAESKSLLGSFTTVIIVIVVIVILIALIYYFFQGGKASPPQNININK